MKHLLSKNSECFYYAHFGGDLMSTATQVTLIICLTFIILTLINKKGEKQ